LNDIEQQELEFRKVVEDLQGKHHQSESLRKALEDKVQELETSNEALQKQIAEKAN